MKKLFAFFLVFSSISFTSVFAQFEPDMDMDLNGIPGLRLDGVYVAPMQDDYATSASDLQLYLRFFEDGTVASALSSDHPAKVMEWLFPGNNVPMGTGTFSYKENNGKLK